jgi:ribosomal protein L33
MIINKNNNNGGDDGVKAMVDTIIGENGSMTIIQCTICPGNKIITNNNNNNNRQRIILEKLTETDQNFSPSFEPLFNGII